MRLLSVNCLITVLAFGLAVVVSPCQGDDFTGPVTFAENVAPILYNNCAECHRPGQIGPMSFMSYDETRPWAKSIKRSVAEKTMPPWHADPQFGHFENDPRLTEKEIATILNWVDQGAPAGDLSKAPAAPEFDDEGWRNGKPDHIFMMEKPYDVHDDVEDEYANFIIPAGFDEDKTILSMELKPGAPTVVHHILVFILPGDLDVREEFAARALMQSTFLTGWAPGTPPIEYADGFGKVIPAGSKLLFQLHYHKEPGPGTGTTDQSMMGVKFGSGAPEYPTTTAWIMDPMIRIPPGDPYYESISKFKFVDDGYILGFVPHMHLRGKDFRFEAVYPDGRRETLLFVPQYDFNWQLSYNFKDRMKIPAGTEIVATAHWDNSADNPNNPDPTQEIYFSEKTTDEMMIGFMEYSYENKPHLQARFGLPEGMGGGFGGFQQFSSEAQERMKNMRNRHTEF